MSEPASIDVVAEALSRITSLHRDKPKFRAFITALLRQLQPIEDAAFLMLLWRDLYQAEGESLRKIAEQVGAPWIAGLTPEEQRFVIRAQILKNHSHGYTPEMSESLGLLFGGVEAFVWNNQNMTFDVNVGHLLTPAEIYLLRDWDILPRPAVVGFHDFVYWDGGLPVFGFDHQEGTSGFNVGYFVLRLEVP